ncbi:MAG: DNA-directed RNA polymerase subunit delta [Bacilli bacterium]|nr:DNA-directed RNA polymerase subunit delta [Bacilli bacterium]MBQ3468956.1 DNA-directed RNA polymerase subunit delta [Bacilli bacterium]
MTIKGYKREDLELMSKKDITNLILENRVRPMSTADLFNKIIDLLGLPKKTFDEKIGDYYMALSTDKRFVLLDNGKWDLKNRYSSDKIKKEEITTDEEDEETDEIIEDEIVEDNYDDDDDYDDAESDDDLKDLVVIDEDELEME